MTFSEPPPGGREVRTRQQQKQEEREYDRRLYWQAMNSDEVRRAMKRIRIIGDALFNEWRADPKKSWPGFKKEEK